MRRVLTAGLLTATALAAAVLAPGAPAALAADGPARVGTSVGQPGGDEIRPSVGIGQNVPGRLLGELGGHLRG